MPPLNDFQISALVRVYRLLIELTEAAEGEQERESIGPEKAAAVTQQNTPTKIDRVEHADENNPTRQ